MEPGGSLPHLQGLSNNPHPQPNQPRLLRLGYGQTLSQGEFANSMKRLGSSRSPISKTGGSKCRAGLNEESGEFEVRTRDPWQ